MTYKLCTEFNIYKEKVKIRKFKSRIVFFSQEIRLSVSLKFICWWCSKQRRFCLIFLFIVVHTFAEVQNKMYRCFSWSIIYQTHFRLLYHFQWFAISTESIAQVQWFKQLIYFFIIIILIEDLQIQNKHF